MLISSKDILKKAQQSGYGVPGFNFYNQDVVESIVETAEALSSPVILMITPIYIENLGLESAAFMARCVAEAARVPVALHLDHGHTYEQAQRCLEAGFTSVMIDGSELPLQENIQLTQKVVALAQKYGASVEAELGAVGGAEDMAQEGAQQKLALVDPEDAKIFVQESGIDSLAPAIGTVHGMTKKEPCLDLPLLQAVRKRVDVPLVLHGGSGLADDTIRLMIRNGISKVIVGTELKIGWMQGLTAYFKTGAYEPRFARSSAKEGVMQVVAKKIELLGSKGKA